MKPLDIREQIPAIKAQADSLEIAWPEGYRSRHLFYWLRENCHCPKCTHQDAWERIVDFMAIPLDIKPASFSSDGHGLHITWPEHKAACDGTFYSWDWLNRHRSEQAARLASKKHRRAWIATEFDKSSVSVDYADVMSSDAALLEMLEHIDDTGVAIVTGVPVENLAVVGLAERVAFLEESHFGRYFDVESKPNPENLAYTPQALYPHNDLPSRRHLPGIQFLHCLHNDARGGESILVDSIASARKLQQIDRAAYNLLSTRKVTFSSIDDDWHIVNRGTIIEVDEDGDITGTRLHPALLGPVDIEPELQAEFYRAHRTFLGIATSTEMQFKFRLNKGDCQVFDNARIMHARSAFDPNSGYRHLQGCYICRDDLQSLLEVLRRKGRDFRQT
jgi:gamma-butyrobetaine dioxygenase